MHYSVLRYCFGKRLLLFRFATTTDGMYFFVCVVRLLQKMGEEDEWKKPFFSCDRSFLPFLFIQNKRESAQCRLLAERMCAREICPRSISKKGE